MEDEGELPGLMIEEMMESASVVRNIEEIVFIDFVIDIWLLDLISDMTISNQND